MNVLIDLGLLAGLATTVVVAIRRGGPSGPTKGKL